MGRCTPLLFNTASLSQKKKTQCQKVSKDHNTRSASGAAEQSPRGTRRGRWLHLHPPAAGQRCPRLAVGLGQHGGRIRRQRLPGWRMVWGVYSGTIVLIRGSGGAAVRSLSRHKENKRKRKKNQVKVVPFSLFIYRVSYLYPFGLIRLGRGLRGRVV